MPNPDVLMITAVAELLQDEFNPRYVGLKQKVEVAAKRIGVPPLELLAEARQLQVLAEEPITGEVALDRAATLLKEGTT